MTIAMTALDRVNRKSKEYSLQRALLTLAMLIPFVIGWVSRKIFVVTWSILVWIWAATVVGWQTASDDAEPSKR